MSGIYFLAFCRHISSKYLVVRNVSSLSSHFASFWGFFMVFLHLWAHFVCSLLPFSTLDCNNFLSSNRKIWYCKQNSNVESIDRSQASETSESGSKKLKLYSTLLNRFWLLVNGGYSWDVVFLVPNITYCRCDAALWSLIYTKTTHLLRVESDLQCRVYNSIWCYWQ